MKQLRSGHSRLDMETDSTAARSLLKQLVISLVAALSTVASGTSLGFSAIALPELKREGSPDRLDTDQASWFASIASIATPLGCLLCGPLLDRYGRRTALLALNAPFLLGWVMLALTPSPVSTPLLYMGRILTGLGTGMASIPGCVYIAEMSDHALRGMLVTWPSIGISVGILVVYVFGSLLQDNWRLVAALSAIFPIVTAVATLLLLRESPVWLMSKGRDKEAENSLKWLTKGTLESVQAELRAIRTPDAASQQDKPGPLSLLALPQAWKPLFILNGYFFFQQFSGIYVVVYYAVDIILQAGVSMNAYIATVLLGVVQLLAGIAVSFALTKCGRRPMTLLSGVGMTVCMVGLPIYLQLVPAGSQESLNLSSIPLLLLVVYVVAGAIGFHTLPWAMLGEMYPPLVKGLAGGLTTCLAYLFSFAALKMYPSLVIWFGNEGVFYMYGVVSLVATLFVLVYLTETHRKTLKQIEDEFVTQPLHWRLALWSHRNAVV